MSALSLLDIKQRMAGSLHPVWQKLYSITNVKKAIIKARLLVQRHPLATSYMAGHKKDICPPCKADTKTTTHFLLQCETTDSIRRPLMRKIMQICRVLIEHEHLTKVLLDPNWITYNRSLEETSRNLIWILHSHRAVTTHPKIARKATPQLSLPPLPPPPTPQQ